VLCHAEEGWNKAVSMGELYDLPTGLRPAVMPHLPEFRMVLDDLTKSSDEQIKARSLQALAALGLLLLRHARQDRSMAELMAEWIDLLRVVWNAQGGRESLATIVRYILLANRRTTIQDLESKVVPLLGTSAREVIMTEGQRLIELGRIEGRNEGRNEGRAAAVIAVLAARGLEVPDQVRDRVMGCTDPATLDRWIALAVTAGSAEDVVREG
jgi:hypothetical protein